MNPFTFLALNPAILVAVLFVASPILIFLGRFGLITATLLGNGRHRRLGTLALVFGLLAIGGGVLSGTGAVGLVVFYVANFLISNTAG